MTREALLHYSYMTKFSRRKGWNIKPRHECKLCFQCDAPFRLRLIALNITGHKTQIKQFTKLYRLNIDGIGQDLPLAGFTQVAFIPPIPIEFKPGSTAKISFEGQSFGKMRKTLRCTLLFSGTKVYQAKMPDTEVKAGQIGMWERSE
jgi:hypothetical protein